MLIILSSTIYYLSVTLMGSTVKRGKIDQQIDNKAEPEIMCILYFSVAVFVELFLPWRIK